jgi:hypothetical protein
VNLVDAETPIKTGLGSTETSIPDHGTRRLPEEVLQVRTRDRALKVQVLRVTTVSSWNNGPPSRQSTRPR